MTVRPRVELFWWEGCPSWQRAQQLVRESLAELGLDPDSLLINEIRSEADAERAGFVGSPTIRIDGRDLQPPGEDERPGLSCRVYRLQDGRYSPLPDPDQLRQALQAAIPQ